LKDSEIKGTMIRTVNKKSTIGEQTPRKENRQTLQRTGNNQKNTHRKQKK